MDIKYKKCGQCGKKKNYHDDFNWRSDSKDLKMSYCKKCMSQRAKEWRENNRAKYNKYQIAYHRKANEAKKKMHRV